MYHQKDGGPIGLKATGTIAKVAMEKWIRGFKKDIQDAGIQVRELIKYVDDALTIVGTLELGARWTEKGQSPI